MSSSEASPSTRVREASARQLLNCIKWPHSVLTAIHWCQAELLKQWHAQCQSRIATYATKSACFPRFRVLRAHNFALSRDRVPSLGQGAHARAFSTGAGP